VLRVASTSRDCASQTPSDGRPATNSPVAPRAKNRSDLVPGAVRAAVLPNGWIPRPWAERICKNRCRRPRPGSFSAARESLTEDEARRERHPSRRPSSTGRPLRRPPVLEFDAGRQSSLLSGGAWPVAGYNLGPQKRKPSIHVPTANGYAGITGNGSDDGPGAQVHAAGGSSECRSSKGRAADRTPEPYGQPPFGQPPGHRVSRPRRRTKLYVRRNGYYNKRVNPSFDKSDNTGAYRRANWGRVRPKPAERLRQAPNYNAPPGAPPNAGSNSRSFHIRQTAVPCVRVGLRYGPGLRLRPGSTTWSRWFQKKTAAFSRQSNFRSSRATAGPNVSVVGHRLSFRATRAIAGSLEIADGPQQPIHVRGAPRRKRPGRCRGEKFGPALVARIFRGRRVFHLGH